ncbi:fructose-specific PTS transporter subunit EIIC [Muricoccus pecuniae]|uniref:protein-N(pi)-phosphohistidine--D-fructose phosphotransferase n=1 Tax=Muricoccus pecuniae TaxID=693023 RepID=A0A840YIV9_9PROT|nr:fructose-specific PTS transporter subunit EIIC [Roseomonas pecuniae]MBB5693884.1 PTS system fructose-specific IIC component [Roseomonas pecuniae]
MSRILALTACPSGTAHSVMAAEALKKQGALLGHEVEARVVDPSAGPGAWPDAATLLAADAVVLATDTRLDTGPLGGRPMHVTSTASAIRDPAGAIHAALALGGAPAAAPTPVSAGVVLDPVVPAPAGAPGEGAARVDAGAVSAPGSATGPAAAPGGTKRLVAITACPTGIAHTFMAAEALKRQATAMGHEIAVETQGSVGAKNVLTEEQIARADAVIIAADTAVDLSRFSGKALYQTDTGSALKKAPAVIEAALATEAPAAAPAAARAAPPAARAGGKGGSGPYKHLLTGVSYMLPVVVAGGLLIALSFVFGIEAFKEPGTLPAALMQIGGGAAFLLMVPVLSGFIAYSIADRPGLAPGLIGGLLAQQLGAGFLGGIVSGFIAGYSARLIADKVRLPEGIQGLMPVLVIPLLATAITGLLMVYVVGAPMKGILEGLTAWLGGMSSTNAVLLGALLGAMMCFDMGGPVNKAAYAFTVGLLSSSSFGPMAATMAAGMVPPLALALATFLAPRKFVASEIEARQATGVLGLCFISEGAIPYVARDPLRVIPTMMIGGAVTGALSMLFGCTLRAPHGGLFVLLIPGAVGNVAMYLAAIAAGTVVAAVLVAVAKRPAVEVVGAA